jgi:hypothetical protein
VRGIALIVLLAAATVNAAPTVEIKAKTQLQFSRARLTASGEVEVTGQLLDQLTGDGISDQRVTVTFGGATASATTGNDGTFTAMLPAAGGPADITLSFPGADRLDASNLPAVTVDPAKSQVQLRIGKVRDEPGGARLRITATVEDTQAALPVKVELAPSGTTRYTALPDVMSGDDFVVTRKQAGGPGLHHVRASFPGDDAHQPAKIDGTLELTSKTKTTLTLSTTSLAYEDDLVARGKVTDEDGQGVPKAAVALVSGDRRLAQAVTGEDGSYKFSVEGQIFGEGRRGVQVQADPGTSYVQPSVSAPLTVLVAPPQPVPVSYTVAAFVATALAAGGFFAARTKPWRRLRRRVPPAEQASSDAVEQMKGGLVVARPGIVSTLRRAADTGFSGVVRDTVRGRPVPQAIVRLVFGGSEREVRTTIDGSFAIDDLALGDWSAEVAAAGHVTEKFTVSIPHRGELRGVRVDLVPVRERVFQIYRRAAEPLLPESRLWGIWSPRQIVDHVRGKRPSPALADLTNFVEEIYFSPRLAEEGVLQTASERVDEAVRERTARARVPS